MKYGVIENGVCVNVILADSPDIFPRKTLVEVPPGLGKGDQFDGETKAWSKAKAVISLSDAKAAKQTEINNLYKKEVRAIVGDIPDEECKTWRVQEEEAKAYAADPAAELDYIPGLAAGRGLTVAELVPRILTKAKLYKQATAPILGKKHKHEDQLDAAATIEEINAIVVE